MAHNQLTFRLPHSIVGPIEFNRVVREAEQADEMMRQAGLRKPGQAVQAPKAGRLLTELTELNSLNILHESDRQQLKQILDLLKTQAPTIHMSFSADPSPLFMRRLITWMREEIHPYLLVRIGLQPTIGAGCIVRTNNKYYDFSLRERFAQQKQILIDRLHDSQEGP